jgi:putative transposase
VQSHYYTPNGSMPTYPSFGDFPYDYIHSNRTFFVKLLLNFALVYVFLSDQHPANRVSIVAVKVRTGIRYTGTSKSRDEICRPIFSGGLRLIHGVFCSSPDHVHIMLSIPPKYSLSQAEGFIKGKSAIQIARNFQGRKKNFVGQNFWSRGYYVSTVGKDEEAVRAYIQNKEREDKRLDQLKLFEQ